MNMITAQLHKQYYTDTPPYHTNHRYVGISSGRYIDINPVFGCQMYERLLCLVQLVYFYHTAHDHTFE